MAGTAVEF